MKILRYTQKLTSILNLYIFPTLIQYLLTKMSSKELCWRVLPVFNTILTTLTLTFVNFHYFVRWKMVSPCIIHRSFLKALFAHPDFVKGYLSLIL